MPHEMGHAANYRAPKGQEREYVNEKGETVKDHRHSKIMTNVMSTGGLALNQDFWTVDKKWCDAINELVNDQNKPKR